MTRTIAVSTDVFAAIWARRQEGEETEDAILRREFGCARTNGASELVPSAEESGGIYDGRNNVRFRRGFEIFRTYKRREYVAIAQDGNWRRKDTGEVYSTLNQLNNSIAAGNENVWNGNWKYRSEDGSIRSIADLRR